MEDNRKTDQTDNRKKKEASKDESKQKEKPERDRKSGPPGTKQPNPDERPDSRKSQGQARRQEAEAQEAPAKGWTKEELKRVFEHSADVIVKSSFLDGTTPRKSCSSFRSASATR